MISVRKEFREGVQISSPEKEHSLAETGITKWEMGWERRPRGERVEPV